MANNTISVLQTTVITVSGKLGHSRESRLPVSAETADHMLNTAGGAWDACEDKPGGGGFKHFSQR